MVSLITYSKNFRLRRSVFIKFDKISSFFAIFFAAVSKKKGKEKKEKREKKKGERKRKEGKRILEFCNRELGGRAAASVARQKNSASVQNPVADPDSKYYNLLMYTLFRS